MLLWVLLLVHWEQHILLSCIWICFEGGFITSSDMYPSSKLPCGLLKIYGKSFLLAYLQEVQKYPPGYLYSWEIFIAYSNLWLLYVSIHWGFSWVGFLNFSNWFRNRLFLRKVSNEKMILSSSLSMELPSGYCRAVAVSTLSLNKNNNEILIKTYNIIPLLGSKDLELNLGFVSTPS